MTIQKDRETNNIKLFLEIMDILVFSALIAVSTITSVFTFRLLDIVDEVLTYVIFTIGFFLIFLLRISLRGKISEYFPVSLGSYYKFITFTFFPIVLSATLATYIVSLVSESALDKVFSLVTILEKQLNQVTAETLVLLPVFIGAFIFAGIVGTQFKKYFKPSLTKYVYLISFFSIEMVFLIASTIVVNTAYRLNFDQFATKVFTFVIIGTIPILSVRYLYFGGRKRYISHFMKSKYDIDPEPDETYEEYLARVSEKDWNNN